MFKLLFTIYEFTWPFYNYIEVMNIINPEVSGRKS